MLVDLVADICYFYLLANQLLMTRFHQKYQQIVTAESLYMMTRRERTWGLAKEYFCQIEHSTIHLRLCSNLNSFKPP